MLHCLLERGCRAAFNVFAGAWARECGKSKTSKSDCGVWAVAAAVDGIGGTVVGASAVVGGGGGGAGGGLWQIALQPARGKDAFRRHGGRDADFRRGVSRL